MRCLAASLLVFALAASAAAHDLVTPLPKVLQSGVPIHKLTGTQGQLTTFKIEIPAQAENFVVKTTGGKGDVDLLLRFGAHPTPAKFDFSSESSTTNELIRVGTPTAGNWYVQIVGYSDYRDVRLTASYELPRGTPRPPRFGPEPGNYAEKAMLSLSRARGTVVRYTLDGTEPTAASPIYKQRITLASSARVRARSFGAKGSYSIESTGDYTITTKGTPEALEPGVPVHHLAAMAGKSHLFKMTVPANTKRLLVQMDGGPGNAQLACQLGEPPRGGNYFRRAGKPGNYATLDIDNPAAGDWFFSVRAAQTYSGVSLLATVQPDGVDLIAWAPALQPYVSTEVFTADDCEVDEGMTTVGSHTFLRFSTQTRNIGAKDLELGDPAGNPAFEYFQCHGHYHFLGFASYQLLDGNNQPVATGRKVSFCLLDGLRWDREAAAQGRFDCQHQGIQSGWADVYDGGLPGQWIDITNVPPGDYTLIITMNPDRLIQETDYTNNSASIPVTIGAPETIAFQ